MWDKYEFKPGDRVARRDGAWGEVLSVSESGDALRMRHTGTGGDPSIAGTEEVVAVSEIISLSPAPATSLTTWGQKVAVVVHHFPEGPESEEGYEAVTMGGVPLGVSITASDAETAQEALERLLGALSVFGYSGKVAVHDVAEPGRSEEYEIEVG